VPSGSEEVVTPKPGGLILSDRAMVLETSALSVTRTVKPLGPAVVGVPEIAPFAARLRPEGREPDPMDQV